MSQRTASSDVVTSRDPMTGEVWRSFATAAAPDVRRALSSAHDAQPAWAARPVRERAALIERFRTVLFARRHRVAETINRETGKPAAEATAAEVAVVLDYARFYADVAERALRAQPVRLGATVHLRKRVHVLQEPYGVVGVIAPWNYPFMLAAGHILPALVAGNAVLFKPSELTTTTGALLVEMLHEGGVPPDMLHLLPGGGETGAALSSAGCDKIFFTGSERTGRAIARACAETLTPYVLELGGSDPAIVLEDADVRTAAAGIAWGRFSNAGQTCVAPKRVFVVDAIYSRFIEALRAEVRAVCAGDTRADGEVAPPITHAQRDGLASQLEDALVRGARITAQADVPATTPPGTVPPFAPTLLEDVPADARVLHEETFGPILPVVRVRDADEAVRRANESTFGLSASVWGRSRALAVAEALQAGAVTVNDVLVAAGIAEVGHGGVKGSGSGRAHGLAGLHECVRSKTIIVDRFPGMRQPWWFRYTASLADSFDAYLTFEHGHGLGVRLRAAVRARGLLSRFRATEPEEAEPLRGTEGH